MPRDNSPAPDEEEEEEYSVEKVVRLFFWHFSDGFKKNIAVWRLKMFNPIDDKSCYYHSHWFLICKA